MQSCPVVITKNKQLPVCELINKSVYKLPKGAHNESDISRVKPEESTTVALVHHFDDALELVFGQLSRSHVGHVANAGPRLHLAGHHRFFDCVLKEEVSHVHQMLEVSLRVNKPAHVHHHNWVLLDVPLQTVQNA